MLETLKKTIYAGIGATVISAEKLNAALNELVEKGKLSSNDAKDFACKIAEEGRKEFDEGSQRVGKMVDDLIRKANFARESDLVTLQKRVDKLESDLEELKNKQ